MTQTFDLHTVNEVQPGRFVLTVTTVHDPDLMKLELKALSSLKNYCSRPLGPYAAPKELFVLGEPDLPVKEIEVTDKGKDRTLVVKWKYPYGRLSHFDGTEGRFLYRCGNKSEYDEHYRYIMNGSQVKEVFDCRHGLAGRLFEIGPQSEAIMHQVNEGTRGASIYRRLCIAVYQKSPHEPWVRERP